jgi:hypothetical protein
MSMLRTAVLLVAAVAGLCVPVAGAGAAVCEESMHLDDGVADLLGETGEPIIAGVGPMWFVVGVRVAGFYRTSSGRLLTIECLSYDIREN